MGQAWGGRLASITYELLRASGVTALTWSPGGARTPYPTLVEHIVIVRLG